MKDEVESKDLKEKIDELNEKAWQINRDEPEKAIEISKEVLSLAKKDSYELGEARAIHNMGMCYGWLSKFEKALDLTETSLKTFEKCNSHSDLGRNHYSIGTIYYYKGDFKRAKSHYEKSLKHYAKGKNDRGVTNAYNGLGSVYTDIGDFDLANDFLHKGLNLSIQIDDYKIRPKIYDGLAAICSKQGNYTLAKEYYEKALDISIKTNQKHYRTFYEEGIGDCLINLGEFEKALDYLNASLTSRRELALKFGEATALQKIGMAYLKMDKLNESQKYLTEAIDLALEIEGKGIAMSIYESLASLYEIKGDTKKVAYNLRKHFALKEELLSEEHFKLQDSNLEQAYLNTKILSEIGQEIIASLELEKVLFTIYEKVNKLMDATVFGIGLFHEKEEQIEYKLAIDSGKRYAPYTRDTKDKKQLAVWCMDNKAPVFINNFEEEYTKYIPEFNFKKELEITLEVDEEPSDSLEQSMLYVPIMSSEGVLGVISVQSREKNVYSKHHLDVLNNIAVYAAIAILNAEIVENLEENVKTRTNELVKEKEKAEFEREEARYQRKRAEQSERFKQQFLANMSHEIRTPMNAIMGMTNLLIEKYPAKQAMPYLESIKNSSESLLVIINDILDLSKIEAGKMELEQTDFSLKEVVRLVEQTISYRAEEKSLIISVSYDEDIPPVLIGDPVRLQQVLLNIAGNAVKFTETGGVTISVNLEGGTVLSGQCKLRFEVRDTGIGMTQDQQSKVFESFSQAASDTTRKYGGTGLGLSISSKLIELFGSAIHVESKQGQGSTFSFIISFQVSKNKKAVNVENEIPTDFLDELKGIRILLAEDNEYNQIVAIETLELKIPDVIIEKAYNGQETCDLMLGAGGNFDVVLMDVQMPVMDGFDATRCIKKMDNEKAKNVPIIALTASVVKKDVQMCFDAGMIAVVPKPFKTSELIEAIYKACRTNERKEEIYTELNSNNMEGDKITSLSFLEDFTEGDQERIQRYVGMYLDSARKNSPELETLLKEEKWAELKSLVHSMKPHFDFMGMKDTRSLAENIEQILMDQKDMSVIPTKIGELQHAINQSIEELGN